MFSIIEGMSVIREDEAAEERKKLRKAKRRKVKKPLQEPGENEMTNDSQGEDGEDYEE